MEPLVRHRGIAAPLLRDNVDTDAIIPSREIKRVAKTGLKDGLFAGWRYLASTGREPVPDFILNKPGCQHASILLSGANFGCGSSREHAVWALKEYGFRVIIASSFGRIFQGNCIVNGLLPVTVEKTIIEDLARQVEADPAGCPLEVDLQEKTISAPSGTTHTFAIADSHRQMLLRGLNPIALTLQSKEQISAFLKADRQRRSWAHAPLLQNRQ